MTDEQKQSERTIDKLHRETGIPMWALETAFELSTLGMLDEETMAGLQVIPDAARVIAGCKPATSMRSRCIEKVKAKESEYREKRATEKRDGMEYAAMQQGTKAEAALEIRRELESLTIQEQKS